MMTETSRFLPPGWPLRVSAAVLAALVGNLAVHLIPWPQSLMVSLNQAQGAVFMNRSELFYRLALTLVSAPLAEEAVFRWGIYGLLRKKLLPVWPPALQCLCTLLPTQRHFWSLDDCIYLKNKRADTGNNPMLHIRTRRNRQREITFGSNTLL